MWPLGTLRLPILEDVARAAAGGRPYVLEQPESEVGQAYAALAAQLVQTLLATQLRAAAAPTVSVDPVRGLVLRYLSGPREGEEHAVPAATARAACRADGAVEASARAQGLAVAAVEARGNYAVRCGAPSLRVARCPPNLPSSNGANLKFTGFRADP